jgi:DegV family protein with EDD domain
MAKIAIITDSTSYIPEDLRKNYPITVLPQVLIWGEETLRDGIDIQPSDFYARLSTAKIMPTTSQATPAAFKQAYDEWLAKGYEILAIVISSKLSGTMDSAIQAKAMLPDAPIEIFDSLTSAMGLGFQVLKVARAIEQGASMQECLALLEAARDQTGVFLTPETLEFLHRGGRIGNATRFLGTALNLKPILYVHEGRVEPLERVRTRRKAINRLVEIVKERTNGKAIRFAALHANEAEGARELLSQAKASLNIIESVISEVSPVIGTHVGPGTLAVCYMIED